MVGIRERWKPTVLEELFWDCSGVFVEAELLYTFVEYIFIVIAPYRMPSYYIGTTKDVSECILSVTTYDVKR